MFIRKKITVKVNAEKKNAPAIHPRYKSFVAPIHIDPHVINATMLK